MATPINVLRTVTVRLAEGEELVYQAPPNNTVIVLMAQVSNNNPVDLTDTSVPDPNNTRVDFGVLGISGSAQTRYLAKNYQLPPGSSADLLSGKLVVSEGESIRAGISTGASPAATEGVDLVLSVLEARNA